ADKNDGAQLARNGWQLIDPAQAALPDAYQTYIQSSAAEFSVAQGIYVETASGWFSDRTVRYLASGRPALVQETGFSRHIPTGKSLLSFQKLDAAIEKDERIARDYKMHCLAARQIAEQYFDSDKVISNL